MTTMEHMRQVDKFGRDIVSRLVRPYAELAQAAPTNDLWRMAMLGHFDAHLKKDPDAVNFMNDGNLTQVLEGQTGLKVVTVND